MYDLLCCHDQLAISAWHLEKMAYIWLSRGKKKRTKLLFEQELSSFSDHFHFTQFVSTFSLSVSYFAFTSHPHESSQQNLLQFKSYFCWLFVTNGSSGRLLMLHELHVLCSSAPRTRRGTLTQPWFTAGQLDSVTQERPFNVIDE